MQSAQNLHNRFNYVVKISLLGFHIYALTIHHQVSVCIFGGVFFGLVQGLLNCSNLLVCHYSCNALLLFFFSFPFLCSESNIFFFIFFKDKDIPC